MVDIYSWYYQHDLEKKVLWNCLHFYLNHKHSGDLYWCAKVKFEEGSQKVPDWNWFWLWLWTCAQVMMFSSHSQQQFIYGYLLDLLWPAIGIGCSASSKKVLEIERFRLISLLSGQWICRDKFSHKNKDKHSEKHDHNKLDTRLINSVAVVI